MRAVLCCCTLFFFNGERANQRKNFLVSCSDSVIATMSASSSSGGGAKATVAVAEDEELTEADKILNIDDLEQSMWLVKVPQFVAEQWSMANNNDILGTLKVVVKPKGPTTKASKQLNMKLNFADSPELPTEYTLDDQSSLKVSQDTFVAFSNESASKRLCIDGKVTKNMQLRPRSGPNAQLGQLIRERGDTYKKKHEMGVASLVDIQKSSTQSQLVEFVGNDHKMELKRKSRGSAAADGAGGGAAGADATSATGVASALRSRVFAAFHAAPTHKLVYKELKQACMDVAGFTREAQLREVLDSYATYLNKGTDRTFYELKAEYRDYS